LVHDALAALSVLDGCELTTTAKDAAELLALVAGQDVAQGQDGVFRIVRGVAKDRIISTVDPEARHGHKSKNRRFDGYKAHTSVDPDSKIIEEVALTPANAPDSDAVDDLLADHDQEEDKPTVVGDSAYGGAGTRKALEEDGYELQAKTPPARNTTGGFTKDDFAIDAEAGTATCPAGNTVAIRPARGGGGRANFAPHCGSCPLRAQCTNARRGRTIAIHPHESLLRRARADQGRPEWAERYRADRPIVERKIAHLMRRAWGGRKARTRGQIRVATDLDTRAGAVNLARLAVLGVAFGTQGWAVNPA